MGMALLLWHGGANSKFDLFIMEKLMYDLIKSEAHYISNGCVDIELSTLCSLQLCFHEKFYY